MTNRIESVFLHQHRLSAAEAELWIVVTALHSSGELRGRLIGPRCPDLETIEIAYPLRLHSRPPSEFSGKLVGRVIIPEPNLWTREMPFHYDGMVELWFEGVKCDEAAISVGLKLSK